MNNKKISFSTIIIIALVALLAGSWGYILLKDRLPKDPGTVPENTDKPTIDPELMRLHEVWIANKEINEDYIGELFFDSGLINVSFVQAKDVYKPNGELYQFYTQGGS